MEKMRFSGLLCLLFLFITVELVMYSEAIQCKAKSREYKGRCVFRSCNLICRHENFQFGKCSRGTLFAKSKCYCYKPCHGVSPPGGVEDPPAGPGTDGPPPSDDPPAAGPGGEDTPPAAGPGGDVGSGSSPPGDDPPVGPGSRGGAPPTGPGSSRQCKSSSREYKGKCTSRNCQIICMRERFVFGKCLKTASKKLKCYCYKPCHGYELAAVGGGDGDDALPSD